MSTLPFSGTINNRIGSGYTVQDGYGFINAAAAVVASTAVPGEVTLNSVASRKNHGAAGDFDIPLPGVECRDAGPNQSYTLVYTFANTLSSVGGAFVVDGTAAVGSVTTTGNQAFVTLTGVTNAQNVTVDLIDVHDTAGHVSSTFPITLSVLIGDTGGNGSVNSTDVSQVKTQVGATVGMGNFRTDLNASGSVSSADVTDVKTHSGTGLP
jgi:hypothetical protein